MVHLRGPDFARVRWATPDVGGNILVHGELSNEYFLAKFGLDTEENETIKFAHLAEKSENGSVPNLSTKPAAAARRARKRGAASPPRSRARAARARSAPHT